MMLLGRRSECAVLDRLLDAARGGRSGVLAVHGEAGIGKTVRASGGSQRSARMATLVCGIARTSRRSLDRRRSS